MEVPVLKKEDQFPLLQVEGGDGNRARLTPTQIPSTNVIRKRAWYRRWPDIFSVSWIMILIFGIASILIYSVMLFSPVTTMRHGLYFMTPNDSKPGTEVFYHQIVPRGGSVSLSLYTDYLSMMSIMFPYMKFKVIFLLDDSMATCFRGRPNRSLGVPMACKQWYTYLADMENFLRNHDNIEFNVMSLSSYMGLTPLRHTWRFLPKQDLLFYARVYSVWQFGGIGLDLSVYNDKYNMHQRMDSRIVSVFRQQNERCIPDEYDEMSSQLENEEETVLTQYVMNLLSNLMNETRSLFDFNSTRPIMDQASDFYRPLVRTHRNKRESDNTQQKTSETTDSETVDGKTTDTEILNLSHTAEIQDARNETSDPSMNITRLENATVQNNNATVTPRISRSKSLVRVSKPFFVFYDISLRNLGTAFPSPSLRRDARAMDGPSYALRKQTNQYLTLDWAGSFIASSSREHPFLAHILTAGCERMNAKHAIETVFLQQCYSSAYCKYINFL